MEAASVGLLIKVFPTLQSLTQCPAQLHLKTTIDACNIFWTACEQEIENDEK